MRKHYEKWESSHERFPVVSGRELDTDGTDIYHPQHPWEQSGHKLYLAPEKRTKRNWPPEIAYPAGPAEALQWGSLPERETKLYGNWYRAYGPKSQDVQS